MFECLGRSLYDYLKKNDYRGFPMNVLRPIAQELLQVSEPPVLSTVLFCFILLLYVCWLWLHLCTLR